MYIILHFQQLVTTFLCIIVFQILHNIYCMISICRSLYSRSPEKGTHKALKKVQNSARKKVQSFLHFRQFMVYLRNAERQVLSFRSKSNVLCVDQNRIHNTPCRCSSSVEHQLPKLRRRVRFPSSALTKKTGRSLYDRPVFLSSGPACHFPVTHPACE